MLDEKSSYITTFSCPFGRYRYIELPFRAVLACDMFKKKIDELFSYMPNVFGIVNDILITGLGE